MISTKDIDTISGGHVMGSDGKIGSVGQVYLDNDTGNPEWVTTSTGMFGAKESFVPLADATIQGKDVHVPFDKAKVKDAPRMDADGELSPAEEEQLYTYYGMTAAAPKAPVADGGERRERSGEQGVVGHDTSGPTTDKAMTRSEEQLNVGTRKEEVGRARLRKHVVTEQQTVTVPVSREEVRIEREPITDANRGNAMDGPAISEEEHEVVLHAERPVVQKEAVAVERIRMDTETVTDKETVTDSVRKEQIEVDDAATRGERTHDKK